MAAIMFTDLVSYSASMGKNETLTLDLLEEHRRILRDFFPHYEGKEVETAGDLFFVIFDGTLQSARCAYEIQKTLYERNASLPPEKQIKLRIGLHVGDVVHLGKNVHGDKVNIAARIQPLAEPEGICMSEDMKRQIEGQFEGQVVKLGQAELGNIQVPVEVWRVVMPWEEPPSEVSEQVKFKLRQKKGQQAVLVAKTVLIFTLFLLAGLYIWQWEKNQRRREWKIWKRIIYI